jgi:CBS domain-containing protein
MRGDLAVHKLMTREPTAIGPNDRASKAQSIMSKANIHHVPVVEGGRFVGLLSANDLLRVALDDPYRMDPDVVKKDLELFSVREVMAEDVVTIGPNDTVREAAKKLATGSFHALPVVEGERLVGILTSTDLVLYLIDD